MNEIVSHFIDHLRLNHHYPDIGRDFVSWGGINLHVYRSLDDPSPMRYEISWPSVSDPSVALYPKHLCESILGADFNYAGFTQRAAPFVHQGSSYTEFWKDWKLKAFTESANPVLSISVALRES